MTFVICIIYILHYRKINEFDKLGTVREKNTPQKVEE